MNDKANMNEDIKKAIEVMKAGGIILYPTDTIWGLGCDATNEAAVHKIYELKRRAENKSMLVLLDDAAKLERYLEKVPEMAYSLIEVSDKPLTIIYDKAFNIAKNLLGENNSVGIRITQEAFSNQLCRQFRRPIVSTSANISGEPSPAIFSEISEEIKQGVDYIVKYRQDDTQKKQASSIIKLGIDNTVKIIRN